MIFILLLLLIGLLFAVLGSERALDTVLRQAVAGAGVPLEYRSLKGSLLHGFTMEEVVYEKRVKAKRLALKIDYPALAEGVVHIEKLHAEDIWVEKGFLKSLIETNSSSTQEQESQKIDALRRIVVDDLDISLRDIAYEGYEVAHMRLHIGDFAYDMDQKADGEIDLSLESNVADIAAHIDVVQSRYDGDIDLDIQERYLQQLLADSNVTFERSPHIAAKIRGDLVDADFDIALQRSSFRYDIIRVAPKKVHLAGRYGIKTSGLDANVTLQGLSDPADYDLHLQSGMLLNDLNNTLHYRLKGRLLAAKPALAKLLDDENLSFVTPSVIDIDSNGTMRRIAAQLHLEKGEIRYGLYRILPQRLFVKGAYDLQSGDLNAEGEGRIFSNAADLNLTFATAADLNRPLEKLKIDLLADLLPKEPFLKPLLAEQNITLQKAPQLHIRAFNRGEEVVADIDFTPLALEADDLTLQTRTLNTRFNLHQKRGSLKGRVVADILSNAGDLRLDGNTSLNLNDINNTLRYQALVRAKAKEAYLQKHLKSRSVDFHALSPLKIDLHGNAQHLDANLAMEGEARVNRYRFKPRFKDTKIRYDLHEHTFESDIDLALDSTYADVRLRGKLSGDSDDLNDTLRYDLWMDLLQREALLDLNLTQLGKVALKLKGSLKNLDARLDSRKLKASVQSSDFDRFELSLKSRKLYLDKLYLALPPEFKGSDAALEAGGYYALKSKKADLSVQLKRLHLFKRTIATNRFRLLLDGEDFRLTPLVLRAKDFQLRLEAKSHKGEVEVHLKNSALTADLKFRKEPLFADAEVNIPSLKKLFAQIDKIYPIAPLPKVDGALALTAKMAGSERLKISLNSPAITLPQGRIERIDLLAYYKPQRIDIPKFDFQLKGFKPKKMNRAVHLAHPAFIVMKGEEMEVDFVLENLFTLKAQKRDDLLSGIFKTQKLYLGLEGYGETRLTTDIQFYKSGPQLAVSGDVLLADTVITYESRVLDVSSDPDIIIIKKQKRRVAADDNFVKNTFLDLHIRSKDEIEYKVEAGTIVIKPDIEVRKDFGSKLKLLGKINILEGEYDLGDKRFQIKEGAIAFRGLEEINPHLDIHVEYPIDEVVIFIDILGDKRKPKLQFKSKPMMSKKDIFSYLLFGFAVSESEGAQSSAANAAEKIFGRALAKDLARELKLDRLDLTRNALGGIDIKAGKKVNKKTIIYYQNRSLESSVIVERKLGKHFELDVEAGQESQAVDLFYKRGYK